MNGASAAQPAPSHPVVVPSRGGLEGTAFGILGVLGFSLTLPATRMAVALSMLVGRISPRGSGRARSVVLDSSGVFGAG